MAKAAAGGSVISSEARTGLAFDRPGTRVVGGGLVPVDMNVDRELGLDVEPNVWVAHPL